ncbi:MAG: amino acid permease [Phycisphaerales bacterium]|nr:amino acid permease [Phycisphaerales bacterium]
MKRTLGFWDVFCLSAGAMISSGLFVLPGQAFAECGPAITIAYALAALGMVPALLAKAELTTAMPKSGGTYFFIERSMGSLAGTLAGLSGWLGLALKSAFAMVGIGAFVRLVLPGLELSESQWIWIIKLVATGCTAGFAVLNCMGAHHAGKFQRVLVIGLLAILAWFVVAGAPAVKQHPNFDNLFDSGFGSILATAGLVFVSFGGLTKACAVAEEVRHPDRNIPRAMLLAFFVVSLLYIACTIILVGTVEPGAIADKSTGYVNLTPLSTAAGNFGGQIPMMLISAAAILAFVTTGNGGILAAARTPLAMARDGILPAGLARLNRRSTPQAGIIITAAFMTGTILLLDIGDLVKVASTMMLLMFLLECLAVLIMRSSGLQNYQPRFKCPAYPYLPIAGIVMYAVLIYELIAKLGIVPLATTVGFVLGGVAWYVFYVRRSTSRESALLYLVKKAVHKDLYHAGLDDELRTIATERDEIIHDRFDYLIADAIVLDLPGPIPYKAVFEQVADELAPRVELDAATLREAFLEREADSSTQILPSVAIPHIILPGHHLFEIALVRCKGGIVFDPAKEAVSTAFFLIGSADERNYHLRALMAIATVVEESQFLDRWLAAPSIEHLRDLILLSKRKRD